MHVALSFVRWKLILFYFDVIVGLLRSAADDIDHVEQALVLLADARITLRGNECNVLTETIAYLGGVVRAELLEISSKYDGLYQRTEGLTECYLVESVPEKLRSL